MQPRLLIIGILNLLVLTFTVAQRPENIFKRFAESEWKKTDTTNVESFFPHHVGDTWKVWHSAYGYSSTVITRDSIGVDKSHFIFYDNNNIPDIQVDTSNNVFGSPTYPGRYVRYKLNADSGHVWFIPSLALWAWVARVESSYVFSQPTVVKVFRYGYGNPNSGFADQFLDEHHLAIRFGLIYRYQEPAWVQFLQGCIIDKDTFGVVTSVKLTNTKLPNSFLLKQNYPNPFNPSTTIEFEIPKSTKVNIIIFDVLGRQIDVLVDDWKRAGNYKIQWNGTGKPSGLYFCKLVSDGKTQTVRMLLTK